MDNKTKDIFRAPRSILKHKPVFRKLISTERTQLEAIDYNSALCLQKLESLLKSADSLITGTRIYSDNKEFLVNLVNNRHVDIVRLIKANIETVRLICTMDRNYRAGLNSAPRLKGHFASTSQINSSTKNLPIPCDLIREINDLNYGGPRKTIPSSEHSFRPMSMDEINEIISNTAKHFDDTSHGINQDDSTKSELFIYQINDPSETNMVFKEEHPLITNDVSWSDAAISTVNDINCPVINQHDNLSDSEFFNIVISTPNNYRRDEIQTYLNTLNKTESVSEQNYVSEIMW